MIPEVLEKNNTEKEFRPKKMLLTVDDYQLMGAAGVFEGKPRVELINGEIFYRNPLTPNRNGHIDKASRFFTHHLFQKAIIRTQGSIRTDEYSEPEPDITILKYKDNFYSDKQATSEDTLLIIEVAVFTWDNDRTVKKKKYATAGIPEYWIVAPKHKLIEVYKKPVNGDYAEKTTYKKKDKWTFDAFDLEIKGKDLLI